MSTRSSLPLLIRLILLLVIGAFNLPQTVAAQNQDEVRMIAQAGFDGYCKAYLWIPIKVTLENSGPAMQGRIEARVSSSTGNTYTYATTVDLPESSHKEFFLYLNTDSYLSELPIYLTDGEKTIQTTNVRLNCLPQADILFGVIASTPSIFNLLNDLDPDNGSASVANIEMNPMPDHPQGWEALDVLFFSDVDTAVLTVDQREALSNWLANGGRLIVTGGPSWQKTATGLEQYLPLELSSSKNLGSLQSLASFTGSQKPLSEPEHSFPIASGELKAGAVVLAEQDGIPLVIRSQYGLGDVLYLTFDPALEPLRNWDGMPDLYRTMLAYQFDQPGWTSGFKNWEMAQEASASMPGITLPSTILVCSFLGLYVAAIGPVNYLVLRSLKRRELAWVTIPAMVIVFSVLTLIVGGISRGRTPIINQASIIQVWPDTGQARADTVVGIYSPRRTSYQVEITPLSLARPIIKYNMAGQDLIFLQNTEKLTIPDLRVDIGGIETFASTGAAKHFPIENQLKLVINQSGSVLQGRVTNQGDLTLEDAVLLYPGGAQSLGDLASGASHDVNIPLIQAQVTGKLQSTAYTPYTTTYSPAAPYTYYDYGYYEDTTMQDILGTSGYYDDKKTYQRFSLLNSALSGDSGLLGRGGGVYLSGWVEESSMDIQLINHASRHSITTLYLISLTPVIEPDGKSLQLTPGMFVWESMPDTASSRSNPYNGTIYINETQHLRFRLGFPISYSSIEGLIFHFESAYASLSPTDLNISLWDFDAGEWVRMDDIGWGDYQVPRPARFVSPTGTIQLSIMNATVSNYEITRSDFTLIVNR